MAEPKRPMEGPKERFLESLPQPLPTNSKTRKARSFNQTGPPATSPTQARKPEAPCSPPESPCAPPAPPGTSYPQNSRDPLPASPPRASPRYPPDRQSPVSWHSHSPAAQNPRLSGSAPSPADYQSTPAPPCPESPRPGMPPSDPETPMSWHDWSQTPGHPNAQSAPSNPSHGPPGPSPRGRWDWPRPACGTRGASDHAAGNRCAGAPPPPHRKIADTSSQSPRTHDCQSASPAQP